MLSFSSDTAAGNACEHDCSEQYVCRWTACFRAKLWIFRAIWASVLCHWLPSHHTELAGKHREATTLSGSLNLSLWLEPAKLWQAGSYLWERCLVVRTCSLIMLSLGQHPHRLLPLSAWALDSLPPALIQTHSFCIWKPSSADLDYKFVYQHSIFLFFLEKKEQGWTKK